MIPTSYPCPLPDGSRVDEYAVLSGPSTGPRLLIIPALFDEGHRMRRLCIDVMRRLAAADIGAVLPDLPGTNESQVELAALTLADWAAATRSAANHFKATHLLAVRGGGLIGPPGLPGWRYGAVSGASQLRTMLRARVIAGREAGRHESSEDLLQEAQERGLELAGYRLGAGMIQQLQAAVPEPALPEIDQNLLAGRPLWLRSEPDADPAQADALAAYVLMAVRA